MVWLGGARISPPRSEEEEASSPRGEGQQAAHRVSQDVPQGPIVCPGCKEHMQEGALEAVYTYTSDAERSTGRSFENLEWVAAAEDDYEVTSLSKLFRDVLSGRYRRRKRFQVKAFRCPSCGYLEFYAR